MIVIGFWFTYDCVITRIDMLEHKVRQLEAALASSKAVMEVLVEMNKENA